MTDLKTSSYNTGISWNTEVKPKTNESKPAEKVEIDLTTIELSDATTIDQFLKSEKASGTIKVKDSAGNTVTLDLSSTKDQLKWLEDVKAKIASGEINKIEVKGEKGKTPPILEATLNPQYIEMDRNFSAESDGGKELELAMALTVFNNLQKAGFIPADAKLSDSPPNIGYWPDKTKGTTYESMLRVMIKDFDKNNKLDLNLDELIGSGMLSKTATPEELRKALSGKQEKIDDSFFIKQDNSTFLFKKSDLNLMGIALNPRASMIQNYSDGMFLADNSVRMAETFISGIDSRISKGGGEPRKVANEAISTAKELAGNGNLKTAREVLIKAGDVLMAAGKLDEAKLVYNELSKPPHGDTKFNLVQSDIDDVKMKDPKFNENDYNIKMTSKNGTEATVNPRGFNSSYTEFSKIKSAQIDQINEMQKLTGIQNFDPFNIDHVKAYFTKLAASKPDDTDGIRKELDKYLKNFYVHAGEGVTWSSSVDEDSRAAAVKDLVAAQPQDAAGRKIIDCEGFTYLTHALLSDIKRKDNTPRFDLFYIERPGHIISGVFDNETGKGFNQNNSDTQMMTGDFVTKDHNWNDGERIKAMGLAISNGSTVFGIGKTQSRSTSLGENGNPKVGSFYWDNNTKTAYLITKDIAEKLAAESKK